VLIKISLLHIVSVPLINNLKRTILNSRSQIALTKNRNIKMKKSFIKFQYLILAVLGILGIISLLGSIINPSNKDIMQIIALVSLFFFGMYFKYLKNKKFVAKGASIFLLYDRKKVNTYRLISVFVAFAVIFILIFLFVPAEKISTFGISIVIVGLLYVSLSSILFPYVNGTLIMINNTDFYSNETGFIKLSQIKKYTLNTDSMIFDLELNNNKKKSIKYNKFVDIDLLKKELEVKFES